MFIISLTYTCGLAEIDKYLDEHIEFLRKHYASGDFLASGRKVPRTGGIILAKVESRAHLDSILEEDPFHREKLAEYAVQEFEPTMAAQGLEPHFM